MGQMQRVCKYKTKVTWTEQGSLMIKYFSTFIVQVSPSGEVTLDNGGWYTRTTKDRMNQASVQYHLGYSVFSGKDCWMLRLPNGCTVPYRNGTVFQAKADRLRKEADKT